MKKVLHYSISPVVPLISIGNPRNPTFSPTSNMVPPFQIPEANREVPYPCKGRGGNYT